MKLTAYYLRGLLDSLQVEGEELQEGDFIDHLIIGVEQEKPLTYFKEVAEEYKLNCNSFKSSIRELIIILYLKGLQFNLYSSTTSLK